MDNEQSLGVTLGRIDATVTAIKENNERRIGNVEQSVMTLSDNQVKQGQEISKLSSAISTSYKWSTVLVTVIGIIVGAIMNSLGK